MAVDYKKLKVGDKVRYLGGDEADDGELIVGKEYTIEGKDVGGVVSFVYNVLFEWGISDYNADCFELVGDIDGCNCDTIEVEAKDGVFSETICKYTCNHDSHIVNLAKEVAELKRELSELKEYVEKEVVLFDERLIEVETKKPSADKTQYITVYGSEYIDKLFGGDSE